MEVDPPSPVESRRELLEREGGGHGEVESLCVEVGHRWVLSWNLR